MRKVAKVEWNYAEVLVENHKPANIKVTARWHEKQNEANIKIDDTS